MLNGFITKQVITSSILLGKIVLEDNQTTGTEQDSEFSFMTEKIKSRPLNKKRLAHRILLTILCAGIFGVVASVIFALLAPKLAQRFAPVPDPTPTRVVIPADEFETEPETETETEAESEPEEESETEEPETEETETEPETETAEPVVPVEMPDLTPEEYQKLQNKLYEVGEETNRAIVTVTAERSDTDWFNAVYSSEDKESGLIVADTGEEILVLTDYAMVRSAERITVTFINEDISEAEIKGYDSTSGLCVLRVDETALSEETLAAIKVATLANSLYLKKGAVVLALGSPLGTNYSILTGTLTHIQDSIFMADAVFTRLETDIVASNSGNGVLTNLSGEVVGYVKKEAASDNTISALSISELKSLIERLSNGMTIPYMGLYISNVTKDIAEIYELPEGVYINSVEIDSPAMGANLLSGDVIVEIDQKPVANATSYRNALMAHDSGEEIHIVVERLGADGYTRVSCTGEVGTKE